MSRIFSRSPFKVVINNGSTSSKVELFIWNHPISEPSSPTKTLSKVSPSLSITKMMYNVSPYIREFISFSTFTAINVPTVPIGTNTSQWCFVRIKVYGNNTLISNTVYTAFDGWSRFEDGSNFDNGSVMLDAGTYEYWSKVPGFTSTLEYGGNITVDPGTGWSLRYTNLRTAATSSFNLLNIGRPQDFFKVLRAYHLDGNKLDVINGSSVVVRSFIFRATDECRYTPVTVDFVNKYGAWQREFFFKASIDTVNSTNSKYNMLQQDGFSYSTQDGQRRTFNTKMIGSIKLNSGIRDEFFAESIRQLMLSEAILVNNLPATLTTSSADLVKSINNKVINYTLDLEYAFDQNNTVQ